MGRKAREDVSAAPAEQTRAERKAAATRARILAVALREFAAEGFDGVSVNAVGARADVANGTVFYHFESKAGLYCEVVRHAADAFHAAVSPKARTPGASFLGVVAAQVAFLRGHPDVAALLWSARAVHPRRDVREAARAVDARLVDVWRQWIAARGAAGRAPSACGDDLARLAAAAVSGLLASRYADPELDVAGALAEFGRFVEAAVVRGAYGNGRRA